MLDLSKYHIHDLTLPYEKSVAGYAYDIARTVEKDGWNARTLHLYSHAGTHIDAPLHFGVSDSTIDQFLPSQLMGKAWLVHIPITHSQQLLTIADLGEVAKQFQKGDSLLLRTDWNQFLGRPKYREELPRISEELANWCVSHQVKMLGVEPPSVADVNNLDEVTNIHHILLKGEVIIIEGLTNLDKIQKEQVFLLAFPLKIKDGDGAPARVVAMEEKEIPKKTTPTILDKNTLFASLPPAKQSALLADIQQFRKDKVDAIIVLDDDPTGTQTVYDIPVLTDWKVESVLREFKMGTPVFYILTNSRSLTVEETAQLSIEIGKNIRQAAKQTQTRFWMISRSDSTLRGHYPIEVTALEEGLGWGKSTQFIIPAFFEGGRYTINNIHYVQQGDKLVPAAQTPYAKDKVFGYQNSNLIDWVVEKTNGTIKETAIKTIDLEELRTKSLSSLVDKLNQLDNHSVGIVNAATYSDLYFFAKAILQSDVQPIFRTAASFVSAIAGLKEQPLLDGTTIKNNNQNGGLVIVGSYVPTSSLQLKHLLTHHKEIYPIEIEVSEILNAKNPKELWLKYAQTITPQLLKRQTVVLYTSRKLIAAATAKENQDIGKNISNFLTQIVANIAAYPAYILTKGGITSSDIATKSLGIKRAMVKGQIIKGVPVWELGKETKFPNSHQIIFPGNVGTESSLTEVVEELDK